MNRIANEEVINKVIKETEILFTIKKRKLEFLRHIISHHHNYELKSRVDEGVM